MRVWSPPVRLPCCTCTWCCAVHKAPLARPVGLHACRCACWTCPIALLHMVLCIRPHPPCRPACMQVRLLDLSSLASVRQFAAAWEAEQRPLHILVNNAGVYTIGGGRGGAVRCAACRGGVLAARMCGCMHAWNGVCRGRLRGALLQLRLWPWGSPQVYLWLRRVPGACMQAPTPLCSPAACNTYPDPHHHNHNHHRPSATALSAASRSTWPGVVVHPPPTDAPP